MADRFPLIVNSVSKKIEELVSGDNLDLTGNGIVVSTDTGAGKYLTSNGTTVFWGSPGDVYLTQTQTITNKTLESSVISGALNTLSDIPNSALGNSGITVNSITIPLGGSVVTPDNNTTYVVSAQDGLSASEKIIRELILTNHNGVKKISNWINSLRHNIQNDYSSHLYSESKLNPTKIPVNPPTYEEEEKKVDGRIILRDNFREILKKYDNIFIDCPPSLSLLTVMALVASDELLVPLQTEFFALEGITQLVKTIDRIKENLNPSLKIRGILLTMFDKRNKLSSEVDREARNYFKEKVYQTVIQRNVRLSEAPSHGLPCVIYDKNCVGSKSYFKLAEEFLKNNQIESAA